MNYNSATYSKFIKIIIVKILLLIIIFTESVFSKPIPPGSGEGDVPANILFLLDNSLSMRNTITEGAGIDVVLDLVELDSGDLILAQGRGKGLLRCKTSRREGMGSKACRRKKQLVGTKLAYLEIKNQSYAKLPTDVQTMVLWEA